ncbi:MAG: FAD-dependent oxidoreductase, partial [Bacteroidota bacterium]
MSRITSHPILTVPDNGTTTFVFEGREVKALRHFTIAAALHQAGYPVHSHSLDNRKRSLECGIGKCGACEMLVDGEIKRICITTADGVKEVREVPRDYIPASDNEQKAASPQHQLIRTTVAIIGAGPAGLAAREELRKNGTDCLVIDANATIGGQFLMQTHQFFFFEKEKVFGGMRGFDIARTLAGEDQEGILLNCTVWDILDGRKLAVKNLVTEEIFFIVADYLVIATGAVPFMPVFENDDLPGVYTAAVVQKMMNQEFTLLGKNILTVGAGNIGYLTSYQLIQAGARVKAIIEAQPFEGGFPVQANRVRRLGIPILTGKTLVKAISNEAGDGITGAIIADSVDFKPVPGTEQLIDGIDAINICTGLVPDDLLLTKGKEIFGRHVWGAGDAVRIGEGTSAVLRGRQVAYEIMEEAGRKYPYGSYLEISKEYIDSQQHPLRVLQEPQVPVTERQADRPFVLLDCLYGFACNPCTFACPHGAITKQSTSSVPVVDYDKCTGCMQCVHQCPGLAIFGYNPKKNWLFLPYEYEIEQSLTLSPSAEAFGEGRPSAEASGEGGPYVILVDNNGTPLGTGLIEKLLLKPNKTNVARIRAIDLHGEELLKVRGFIPENRRPQALELKETSEKARLEDTYVCHCDDVQLDEIMEEIGERKYISIDEIKHTTRLGMGACRGKRCTRRLKTVVAGMGISIVGEPTPRGPMSNQVTLGDLLVSDEAPSLPTNDKSPDPASSPSVHLTHFSRNIKQLTVPSLVAGGGIAGSSLFRYLSEAGLKPLMINYGHGASWRNIAGGRPAFSVPELAEIATNNLHLFEALQKVRNIDFRKINYVNFAHDEESYRSLEASMSWQDAYIVEQKDFGREISPYFNSKNTTYRAALITRDCWQATPGKTIDTLRHIGINHGGMIEEDCRLLDLFGQSGHVTLTVKNHDSSFTEYHTDLFINALGPEANYFAKQAGYDLGLYPVKHQAFITRRMPWMGVNGNPLGMLIDRRKYKGFVAVYG